MFNAEPEHVDLRVKRTRRLLKQAFNELLAETDFENITVHAITERAQVNRATFYLHFEDKYALLSYSIRENLQGLMDQRLPDAQTFTGANLRALTVIACEFVNQFYLHCYPNISAHGNMIVVAQMQMVVYDILREWLTKPKQEPLPDGVTEQNAASILSWVIFGVAFQAARTDDKHTPEQLADQMLAFMTSGLSAYLSTSLPDLVPIER